MQQRRLQQRIDIQSDANNKMLDIKKLLPFEIDSFYFTSQIKETLQQIYNKLDIKKTAKATDIQTWYYVKPSVKDQSAGYKIIGRK